MNEPSEETRWAVTVMLAIAAIGVNTPLVNTTGGIFLSFILLAICGGLAMRYPPYQ